MGLKQSFDDQYRAECALYTPDELKALQYAGVIMDVSNGPNFQQRRLIGEMQTNGHIDIKFRREKIPRGTTLLSKHAMMVGALAFYRARTEVQALIADLETKREATASLNIPEARGHSRRDLFRVFGA